MARPLAEHGTTNRWRTGCRCNPCTAAHTADTVQARRATRTAALAPHRARILQRLAAGRTMPEAVDGTGLTQQAVYGVASWDDEWSRQVDEAMTTGRPANVRHGTPTGYKTGCRCPECRATKHTKAHGRG